MQSDLNKALTRTETRLKYIKQVSLLGGTGIIKITLYDSLGDKDFKKLLNTIAAKYGRLTGDGITLAPNLSVKILNKK